MPVVLDISSDEEQGLEKETANMNFRWIKELLEMSDDEKSDDSDEVVIVHEKKPEVKLKSLMQAGKGVDDDDDCVILDCDPEKGVTSVDDDATGSDDLLVIGEKGQIACRDYPHARHLCAKFPFSSTPHERHCDQCHCYVCDTLAPCRKWGTGILSTDHCHADDKTEIWKIQRKDLKLGKSSPLLASTNHGTSVHVVHSQCNDILPRNIIHSSPNSMLRNQASRSTAMLTCPLVNSMPQNQASQLATMHAFPPSLHSSVQNEVSRVNNSPLRRQMLGVHSHAIQRGRRSRASSLGPQFLHSHVMSKVVGHAGDTLTVNHYAHGSSGFSNHVNPTQQRGYYHIAAGFSNDRNHNGLNDVWLPGYPPLCSLPSSEAADLSCVGQYTVASDSQAYLEVPTQSNDDQDFYQSSVLGNDAPSSYVTCLNANQQENEHQIRSQNENASGNITHCGIASQDTYQPEPQEESPSETARRADCSAFGTSWTQNNSQSIEPLIECSHVQSSASKDHCESTHVPSALDDLQNWLLDKDSVPVVTSGDLLSELNVPSPDLSPIIDTGMPVSQWW